MPVPKRGVVAGAATLASSAGAGRTDAATASVSAAPPLQGRTLGFVFRQLENLWSPKWGYLSGFRLGRDQGLTLVHFLLNLSRF